MNQKKHHQSLHWPPPYGLRYSKKARYVRLVIHPEKGLELIVPVRVTIRDALAFLKKKRSWLEKHHQLLRPESIAFEASRYALPDQINLRVINEVWPMAFESFESQRVILTEEQDCLRFSGKIHDFRCCFPHLQRWLKTRAQQHLSIMIREISEQINLPFNALSFRFQKTMWGSCSTEHNISLNCNLLFLDVELVRYVLIHELCHTRHLDHSMAFWQLVGRFEPNYRTCKTRLRRASDMLPGWMS